jgi:hypothetical protein
MADNDYQTRDGCRATADTIKRHIDGGMDEIRGEIEGVKNTLKDWDKRFFHDNGRPSWQTRLNQLEAAAEKRTDDPTTWKETAMRVASQSPISLPLFAAVILLLHKDGCLKTLIEALAK